MRQSIELSPQECRQLLETKSVGRIAFRTGNGLRVLPVNYMVRGDRIVFRTAAHGVIARSIRAAEAAFEVDELDEHLRSGWSVLAVGTCRRLEDAEELRRLRQEGVPMPWAPGERGLYFAVTWRGLSGRRLGDE